MSSIESLTAATSGATTAQDETAQADTAGARISKQVLGQEDFLKLLAMQFSSQDPLKPMEDTDFIAQMANFSALEIQNSMSASMASLSSTQQMAGAQSLLGKNAEVIGADGSPISGLVTSVRTDGEKTMITINSQEYDFAAVRRVQLHDAASNPQP